MSNNLFITDNQKKFLADLEAVLIKAKNSSTIALVLELCEQKGVDPEVVASFLPQTIKDLLETEGREYNLLPKKQKLPI